MNVRRAALYTGTTAVGCGQFSAPMTVSTDAGESVTMNQSDGSTFVGFVSGSTIRTPYFFFAGSTRMRHTSLYFTFLPSTSRSRAV